MSCSTQSLCMRSDVRRGAAMLEPYSIRTMRNWQEGKFYDRPVQLAARKAALAVVRKMAL